MRSGKPADSSKRIAILAHAADRRRPERSYIIDHFAGCWREDGHEVVALYGTERFVHADLILVHVDLSVVPEEYLEFAARYPIVLNGRVGDIRKSVLSENLVGREDPWGGAVIVKSDLNYGGNPERMLAQTWLDRRVRAWGRVQRIADQMARREPMLSSWQEYQVFDRLSDVPDEWFENRNAVVERFRPEFADGLYHLRMYQFMGDRWVCTRLASPYPILKAETSTQVERIEPHPEVIAWRERLGMDYGKLDYVINDGEVVLLDANKTTGASRHLADSELQAMRRYLAEGMYSYLRGRPDAGRWVSPEAAVSTEGVRPKERSLFSVARRLARRTRVIRAVVPSTWVVRSVWRQCENAARVTGWSRAGGPRTHPGATAPAGAPSGRSVPVVVCTWQRIDRLGRTLDLLRAQTHLDVELHVWNNNWRRRSIVDSIVSETTGLRVEVTHSRRNIGGFGRYYLARRLASRHPFVIFIDDDQTFSKTMVEDFMSEARVGTISSYWAFRFRSAEDYWNQLPAEPGSRVHYCGTGGMVVDTRIFREPGLFRCPRRFWFVEDLWLSFYASHVLSWELFKSGVTLSMDNDGHDQFLFLRRKKSELMRYLVRAGWELPLQSDSQAEAEVVA